jgi:hypothetical protein
MTMPMVDERYSTREKYAESIMTISWNIAQYEQALANGLTTMGEFRLAKINGGME